ncbi:glycosyltransferase [Roseofilum casamattae]|uniref:Glycosyltransferase n=1 Tax=Roseofilum casamattae BLCC-M143 TaxID=3022442 RepID=A0ABT7BVG8_9CYAN|nr:glycosyltransferase [Roseofilum casamattae]MDJ1182797.1 glycosyltransferase [Roseofilum casamattae BLCC-M143]
MTAKIAIVLATYNPHPTYFQKQIQSLREQTWQNWICYVVDDRSSAESQAIITSTLGNDCRFCFFSHSENTGSYHNFERGLQLCAEDETIDAIATCDQDDIWIRDKLETQWQALESKSAILVHSDLELIDGQDKTRYPSAWEFERRSPQNLTPERLLLRNTITGCAMMFRSELLAKILPFPLHNGGDWCHDWWIALMASHQGAIAHLTVPLVRYRIHESNSVGVVRNAGTFSQELIAGLQKAEKLQGLSYITHRNLNRAVCDRENLNPNDLHHNPFSGESLNFGLPILCLGWQSWQGGYGSPGIAMRVFVHKCRHDLARLFEIKML